MGKKLCFLTSILLVSSLCVLSQAAVPERALDVNNFSFELDKDGEQVTEHSGDLGIGWDIGNNKWIGQDVTCEFNPDDEDFCKDWPASDGHIIGYIQTNDIYFQQILEDEVILANHQYKLTMDALSWDPAVRFTASVFYFDGSEEYNAASKDIILEPLDEPDTAEWTEYSVVVVAPPGHPGIGKPLGIKWFAHIDFDDWRWAHLDNIRVTEKLATDAWKPNPEDKAINVPLDLAQLSWSPGLWADTHNVYFGTDWEDVNSRDANTLVELDLDVNEVNIPFPIQLGGEYYWLVEEINDAYIQVDPCDANYPPEGPWPGPVWSFKTNDGKAYAFSPGDGEGDVPVDANLQWTPGVVAASHDLYFGTNFDDVNSRDPNLLIEGLDVNSWAPSEDLALGQRYYWAVDEVNEAVLGSPWQSKVMSFTVIGYRAVDDMESYESGVNEILGTWEDGYTNPSTSYVFLQTADSDANYVHGGENSMRFQYDNRFPPYYALGELPFDSAQDWTVADLKVLTLYLRGDFLNEAEAVQPMYIQVSDDTNTGTVQYEDSNDLVVGWMGWQEWNIELQDFVDDNSVNLAAITKLGIKIGDGETEAPAPYDVYFDDIRLYPRRCVVEKARGSFTNDCDVDIADLAALSRDWLLSGMGSVSATVPSDDDLFGHWTMDDNVSTGSDASKVTDISGNDNHGILYDDITPQGDPDPGATSNHSVAGVNDLALEFDGDDDYVEISALDVNSNTITLTAWVKREFAVNSFVNSFAGIVFSSNAWTPKGVNAPDPNYTAGLQFGADTDTWEANYELSYMWTGYSWEWHSGLFVPPDEWTFTALTVAPDVATLYLSDGISLQAARNYDTHEPLLWNTTFHIADQMQYGPPSESDRFFYGVIDDVRIYNRTLSPEEIASLAGVSSAELGLEPWRVDANEDDIVNFPDFVVIADNWLTEVLWP
jgi:hypothetical protein